MCGRFALSVKTDEVEKLLPELYSSVDIKPSYNIAPTNQIAIIINQEKPKIQLAQWGLIPFWSDNKKIAYKMINARAETILEKPSFKNAFKKKRCLIPATGFFEWKKLNNSKMKIPYYIRVKTEKIFTFAGIWDNWIDKETGEEIISATIITTNANNKIAQLHNRMPVIIEKNNREKWISHNTEIKDLSKLMKPSPSDIIEFYEISKMINNPNNNFEELIKPL